MCANDAPGVGPAEAYASLDVSQDTFLNRALIGHFVWCVGSGISMSVLPSTGKMVMVALRKLRTCVQANESQECLRAFDAVMALVGCDQVSVQDDPEGWSDIPGFEEALGNKYSEALDEIDTHVGDEINVALDVVQIPRVFGNSAIEPGPEHRMLAILLAEGVIDDVITTNWDCLVEKSFERLLSGRQLSVVAHPDELTAQRPRLLKIHGCARGASADPDKYGPYVIATSSDIRRWTNDHEFLAFREEVHSCLRKRALAVAGSSVRDQNLRTVADIAGKRQTPHATDSPRAVFVEEGEISHEQKSLLKSLHGGGFRGQVARRLAEASSLHLRASELFMAFWAHSLEKKLRLMIREGEPTLGPDWLDAFDGSSVEIIKRLGEYASNEEPLERERRVATEVPAMVARLVSIHTRLRPPPDLNAYEPFAFGNVEQVERNTVALQAGAHLPVAALLMLLECARVNDWKLSVPLGAPASRGQLVVGTGALGVRVFVLRDSVHDYSRAMDMVGGEDASDCVLIFCRGDGAKPSRADLPRSALPSRRRTGGPKLLSLDGDILRLDKTLDDAVHLLAGRMPLGVG